MLFPVFNKMMDLLNIDNRSKNLGFKRFKGFIYMYYPKFVKAYEKHAWSIDRLLKNVNVLK